jgi:hypothetical protein
MITLTLSNPTSIHSKCGPNYLNLLLNFPLPGSPTADPNAKIEIVFPVSEQAVAQTDSAEVPLVPGVKGGEGCSTAGGCANCPFMKMNDLDALLDVCEQIPAAEIGADRIPIAEGSQLEKLSARIPEGGKTACGTYDLIDGTIPISYMRHMMSEDGMNKELVSRVTEMNREKGIHAFQDPWYMGKHERAVNAAERRTAGQQERKRMVQ